MVLIEVVVMKDGGSFESMSKGELVAELKKLYEPVIEDVAVERAIFAVPHIRGLIENFNQENFIVLYLDEKRKVVDKRVVFIGTLNRSLVHPRETFFPAIVNEKVKSIIVAHNHPSGNDQPSLEDIEMTRKLIKAGEILGVELFDHVIVTPTNYYSFKNNRRCF